MRPQNSELGRAVSAGIARREMPQPCETAAGGARCDWSCALEGDKPFSCRGYIDEDGQNLALNLVLYAIGY